MKRWLTGGVVVLVLLSLSACDPYGPATDQGVELRTELRTDGSATVRMFFDGTVRDTAQLRATGLAVAERLFPEARSVSVRVDANPGGYPFVVLGADGVFRPGAHPRATLDTRDAVAWLLDHGTRSVDLALDAPRVPLSSTWSPQPAFPGNTGAWSWPSVTDATDAPSGRIDLAPRPWLGVVQVVAPLAAVALLAGSLVAFRRRRRGTAALLAVVSLAGPAVLLRDGGALPVQNLGVAGWLPHPGVTVAAIVTTLVCLLVVPAVLLLVPGYVFLGRTDRDGVGSPV